MHEAKRIVIHSSNDFDGMRRAGKLAAETLDMIAPHVVPGVSTDKLNRICHEFIIDNNAVPSPLNYRGYPKSICTSINHVVCHGIPGDKKLIDGDVLNIDVTVTLDGWFGDTSRMFTVGKAGVKARKLIDVTFDAMWKGINVVKPGATTGDIGHAIQEYAESHGYSVVRDFCGHGLGRVFHDAPNIMHFGNPSEGVKLKEGMFFTIEPMINFGKYDVKILQDGWTAVTRDKTLSAQFEHSIAVTKDGFEVFTKSPAGLDKPPYDL
ncbi:MAG: type I methionyl aminopeptidase [Rhodospirillaceae bacterium]|nr:type I methionyl aminopeptidase [Rhodospirillaceae bacterium]